MRTAALLVNFWSPASVASVEGRASVCRGLLRRFSENSPKAIPSGMLESTQELLGTDKKGNHRSIFLYDGRWKSQHHGIFISLSNLRFVHHRTLRRMKVLRTLRHGPRHIGPFSFYTYPDSLGPEPLRDLRNAKRRLDCRADRRARRS